MNEHTDTSLTDYALDELDPAARREVERRLAADPALQHDVEEIAGLAGALRQATAGGRVGEGEIGRGGDKQSSLREALEMRLAAPVVRTATATHHSPPRRWVIAAIGGATTLAASTLFILSNVNRENDLAYLPDRMGSFEVNAPAKSEAQAIMMAGQYGTPGDQNSDGFVAVDASGRPAHSEWSQLTTRRSARMLSGQGTATSPPSATPTATPSEPEFVPYSNDFQFFEQPDLSRYGNGVRPNEGWFGTAEYLNWAVQTPGQPQAGQPATPSPVGGQNSTGANSYSGPATPSITAGAVVQRNTMDTGLLPATNAPIVVTNPTPAIVNGGTVTLRGGATQVPLTTPAAGAVVTQQPTTTPFSAANTLTLQGIAGSVAPAQTSALPLGETPTNPNLPTAVAGRGIKSNLIADTSPKDPVSKTGASRFRADGLDDDFTAGGRFGELSELQKGEPLSIEGTKQLADLKQEVRKLAVDRETAEVRFGRNHPQVKELESRQKSAERFIDTLDPQVRSQFDTEAYDAVPENAFLKTLDAPLSTFSIDVDTASYSNVRRMLTSGQLPPPGAVRLEEFINYFTYDYPTPTGDDPFAVTTEAARCPWNADHVLVRVGLKGRVIDRRERPATNLVFLVDVSGSMDEPNKLPLVRESLKMMTRELGDSDRVAIVVYAGSSGLALDSTGGHRKQTIVEALDRLQAGGSTNGAEGIQLAYQIAAANFIKGGVNRVVLATDGDFNVGVTSQDELVRLIEEKAKSGVFFSALGYGFGNLKDSTLEKLADKGNGNYAYIDTLGEAHKVLVEQMSGTLVTIAKDVKIQIEFNPARVAGYRLLGYENRVLAAQDFNDDKKDAGEIGAGHTVTALYELIPTGKAGTKETAQLPAVDPLKYQQPKQENELTKAAAAGELMTLKLRYKQPDGDVSKLIERPLKDDVQPYAKASGDFKFAAAVTSFGMLLRHSHHAGSATYDAVLELAGEGLGKDEGGYRKEFLELVRKAKELSPKR